MRDQLTVLNAFVHDVATGTWIASLALATMLHSAAREPAWACAGPAVAALERRFAWITFGSLGVILLTGAVRAITFKAFGWTGDVARERVRILKIKHALLGVAFAAGTAWQVALLLRA